MKETKESYISQSKVKFNAAENLFLNGSNGDFAVDSQGQNAAQFLCLSVELALKSLSMYYNVKPPHGHNLTHIMSNIPKEIPKDYKKLIQELDGMYTLLRYDSDFDEIKDIGNKLTKGNEFVKYVDNKI